MNFGISKTLHPKSAEGYLSLYLSLRDIDKRKEHTSNHVPNF